MSLSDATNIYHLVSQMGPGGVIVMAIVLAFVVTGAVRGWWYSAPAYNALDETWKARFQERDQAWRERFNDMETELASWKMHAVSIGRTTGAAVQVAEAAIKVAPTL